VTTPEVTREVLDDLYAEEIPGYVPPPSHDPSLYRDDPYLAIADYARERFAAGDTLADNPYPPGSRAYMEFGGVMLDQLYDRR
jgi:hypothetical protein